MREVELKGIVPDLDAARAALLRAGATLVYAGRLEDKRYDTPERGLGNRDHVLRLRVYRGAEVRALLDWKGPTGYEDVYKVREELSVPLGDGDAPAADARPPRLRGHARDRPRDRAVHGRRRDGAVRALPADGRARRAA